MKWSERERCILASLIALLPNKIFVCLASSPNFAAFSSNFVICLTVCQCTSLFEAILDHQVFVLAKDPWFGEGQFEQRQTSNLFLYLTRVLVVLVHIDADVAVAAVLVGRALLARARVLLLFLLDQRLHEARNLNYAEGLTPTIPILWLCKLVRSIWIRTGNGIHPKFVILTRISKFGKRQKIVSNGIKKIVSILKNENSLPPCNPAIHWFNVASLQLERP